MRGRWSRPGPRSDPSPPAAPAQWLLGVFDGGFPFPILLCVVNNAWMGILARAAMRVRGESPTAVPRETYLRVVVPIAVCTALDVICSNESLERLSVSFHTMIKASSPMWVLLFALLHGLERPDALLVGAVGLISSGTMLTAYGHIHAELLGSALALAAVALAGYRWALTQLLLQPATPAHAGSPRPLSVLDTVWHISPVIAAVALPLALGLEARALTTSVFLHSPRAAAQLVGVLSVQSCLIFALLVAEYLVVQNTSVLTLAVAGMVKELSTILLAVLIWGDRISALNAAGFGVCLVGIAVYQCIKLRQLRTDKAGAPGVPKPTAHV